MLTTGFLYIVSKDETLNSSQSLSGKTLALPFKNDMPDFVLRRLNGPAATAVLIKAKSFYDCPSHHRYPVGMGEGGRQG
ncbi:hypothetical protein [Agrobacterium deltaense]|uniref:hypothetical protein n=1 Tax=Agrobacterium deltaense TaxID=1183412 RepID=UPI001CB78469|nr:hypothetical protein [Agrobacterium deltaense]